MNEINSKTTPYASINGILPDSTELQAKNPLTINILKETTILNVKGNEREAYRFELIDNITSRTGDFIKFNTFQDYESLQYDDLYIKIENKPTNHSKQKCLKFLDLFKYKNPDDFDCKQFVDYFNDNGNDNISTWPREYHINDDTILNSIQSELVPYEGAEELPPEAILAFLTSKTENTIELVHWAEHFGSGVCGSVLGNGYAFCFMSAETKRKAYEDFYNGTTIIMVHKKLPQPITRSHFGKLIETPQFTEMFYKNDAIDSNPIKSSVLTIRVISQLHVIEDISCRTINNRISFQKSFQFHPLANRCALYCKENSEDKLNNELQTSIQINESLMSLASKCNRLVILLESYYKIERVDLSDAMYSRFLKIFRKKISEDVSSFDIMYDIHGESTQVGLYKNNENLLVGDAVVFAEFEKYTKIKVCLLMAIYMKSETFFSISHKEGLFFDSLAGMEKRAKGMKNKKTNWLKYVWRPKLKYVWRPKANTFQNTL